MTVLFVALQTAVAVGEELDDKLPHHEYYEYFGPDYTLHVPPSNMANQNSRKDLDNLRSAFRTLLPSVLRGVLLVVGVSRKMINLDSAVFHGKLEFCSDLVRGFCVQDEIVGKFIKIAACSKRAIFRKTTRY
jgi:hypothetical protein